MSDGRGGVGGGSKEGWNIRSSACVQSCRTRRTRPGRGGTAEGNGTHVFLGVGEDGRREREGRGEDGEGAEEESLGALGGDHVDDCR